MRRCSKSTTTVADAEAIGIEPGNQTAQRLQTRLTSDQVDQLIGAYQDGLSMEDLASAFSIDPRTAGNHLKRRGIPSRSRKLTDEQIYEASELYQQGWSLARLGQHYGHSESIRYRFKRVGMQLRSRNGLKGAS